jgi:hypothetical protein
MTRQKSFKRRVRARMEKTGESYAAARGQLLPSTDPAPPAVEPPMADDVVRDRTGKTWSEWFGLLDRWGGADRSHAEIAAWLRAEHGVSGWWAQSVTVAYERARGLRAPGQQRGGLFEVTASKTIAVPVDRLFAAFADEDRRGRWLPGAELRERTSQPGRSARYDWQDGSTRVNVYFAEKGPARSHVAVQHVRLASADAAEEAKAFWRERLAALKQALEDRPALT